MVGSCISKNRRTRSEYVVTAGSKWTITASICPDRRAVHCCGRNTRTSGKGGRLSPEDECTRAVPHARMGPNQCIGAAESMLDGTIQQGQGERDATTRKYSRLAYGSSDTGTMLITLRTGYHAEAREAGTCRSFFFSRSGVVRPNGFKADGGKRNKNATIFSPQWPQDASWTPGTAMKSSRTCQKQPPPKVAVSSSRPASVTVRGRFEEGAQKTVETKGFQDWEVRRGKTSWCGSNSTRALGVVPGWTTNTSQTKRRAQSKAGGCVPAYRRLK